MSHPSSSITYIEAISFDRDDVLSGLEVLTRGLVVAPPVVVSETSQDGPNSASIPTPSTILTQSSPPYPKRLRGAGHFDSLRKISIARVPQNRDDSSKAVRYLLQILNNSRWLTHLELPASILIWDLTRAQQLSDVITSDLPHLEQLSFIGSQTPLVLEHVMPVLRASFRHPQLKGIEYDCKIVWSGDFKEIDETELESQLNSLLGTRNRVDEGSQVTAIMPRLRSLILPYCAKGYPPSFLINLFSSHVPNLERVGAFSIRRDQDISSELESAIASGCPKLQHILSPTYNFLMYEITSIRAMYRACSNNGLGLKSFYARMFSNEDNFENGQNLIETFVEHDSETLEVFDIPYSYAVKSKNLQSILSSCKNLKRYCGYNDKDGQVAFAFKDIVSKEWVCHDLKELCIQLNRRDREFDHDIEEDDERFKDGIYSPTPQEFEEMEKMAKDVYSQIGRLSKLEGLAICCDEDDSWDDIGEAFKHDLTLEKGWLKELAGLKELKHFQMMTDFWSCMGQTEVEFMHEHWPSLERITFGYGWSCSADHIWEKPHWQWLRSQRPSLEYGYDSDIECNLVQKRSDIQ
ncbi:hypothetical protein BGZ80_010217 [Entomortierella chlamydospora]|uniref:Uncharacterized protein n=1 Tax=Entomortierella chlamydospora TaxID=101097 RepID=A0A9P6N3D7_9FUNG|nr:hypothetical protein BGZ80_010217 [Entomortierella chlamydospora]